MLITRQPSPSLRPFVRLLWAVDRPAPPLERRAAREHVLPSGEMHVVFRLTEVPLRLYDGPEDSTGRCIGRAIVGGVASSYYLRDISTPARSVGVQLHPGACELLFGAPATELAGRHESLETFWGASAGVSRERLLEAHGPDSKLALLESLLAARLSRVRGLHPAVAHALSRFETAASVGQVVRESGWSHRRFIALFRGTMGMPPKVYSRLLRFQAALRRLRAEPEARVLDIALDAGYSDQPHFHREFLEFAGVTPGEYRSLAPAQSHHVRIGPPPA